MNYQVIIDLKEYIVETLTDGYYKNDNNLTPFKVTVTNYSETEDEEAREEISIIFLDIPPQGDQKLIQEEIISSLFEGKDNVLFDRRDYLQIKHSAGYVIEDSGEIYPFSVEIMEEEGETDIVEIIWDDDKPDEDDVEMLENLILDELN